MTPTALRRDLSVSSLDEAPELLTAAERHGFSLEYTGFADARALTQRGVKAFAASPLRRHVTSLHGPYLDLVPGSMDDAVDALARRRVGRALEACEELGVGRIVFHSGWTRPIYPDGLWIENNGIDGGSLDIPALCELLKRACPEASWNLGIRNGYEASMAAVAAASRQP